MSTLSLRISLEGGRVTKTIQFHPNTTVFDACKIIRDKFAEAVQGQPSEYGLFISDEQNQQGVWLEPGRSLSYYILHNQDTLEYRRKLRTLRVRMLDGAVKTILVDDSQPVSQLMVVICTKIGITNHEEYGLVREDTSTQNENLPDNKFGTLTLRRKFTEKDRDAKMESLRKKLKTDDEINWVDVGKTLREQGIDESETVLLRRRFFFSDQNIDSRDPVQLNLLYVQARDAILDGTHPVTQDKACEFAGIQVHIQFGPHNEAKHKLGFLDLKDFLPQSYVRVKNIEKKVYAEHKKHVGLSEIDAKVLYTKTARELPTYGVTFFLVKEKMTGKNKLVPRLLGVTKDSVLRLDERTKEILISWPLTTVRRWGASPNTFTLDFGDYANQYYSVQTTEAEQIVQLIAGYIDIILKKKQTKDHFGIEGDEGSTMVEESVAPSKATFLQHETNRSEKVNFESLAHPGQLRVDDGEKPYLQGEVPNVQYGAFVGQVNHAHQPPMTKEVRISTVHLTEPQRALLSYISAGQDVLIRADEELRTKAPIQELGTDLRSIEWRENTLDTSKQAVTSHVATMSAATAQIITASQPDEVDTEAISASVSQIAQTIPEVTKEVRLIAALMEDDSNGDKLLEAARNLCNAFSDLLKAAEPESKEPPQNLINAASRVGEATTHVLSTIAEEEVPENRDLYDMLLALAKAVANTTAALVMRAKSIAASCEDEESRNRVIGAASQCALATSQLVACAKVVAPTLHNAACREQLEAAARNVARAVNNLCEVCHEATNDPKLKNDLLTAAREVSRSLTDMLDHVKLSSREYAQRTSQEMSPVENVIIGTDILVSSNDPQEMVRHAKTLGQATAQLIQSIKGEADQQEDADMQRRLLSAAKQLADATAKLVEAARLCSSNPHDSENQNALRRAAEELREITTTAANTPAMKRSLIQRLEYCSKQAASAATQCITAAQNAVQHSDDHQTKETLLQDCKRAADTIPRLVTSVKTTRSEPDDPNAQLNLIEAAEQFIEPAIQMSRSARALQPTVTDIPAASQLSKYALYLGQTVSELNSAAQRAREACGGQELESALEAVRNLHNVLGDTRNSAQTGTLRPLPGETVENTAQQLRKSAKSVSTALSQLVSSVLQGQRMYAGIAGRDTALALGDFTKSVHGVAATTKNPVVISCADEVVLHSSRLIEEAQRTLQNIGDNNALTHAARDVTAALSKTVDCIPGQREVDSALRNVSELSEILSMSQFPPSHRNYNTLQSELKQVAEDLSLAGGHIVQSYDSPAQLAETSQNFAVKYSELLSVSMEIAGQTQDETIRTKMIECLRNVSTQSCSLLSTAKSIAADPGQPNSKNLLHAAARSVTDSINKLVDASIQSAPGQKECDNAMRNIEALRVMLDYPHEPINDQGYFDCVETATTKSRNLGYAISEMINNAKQSSHAELAQSVNGVNESIHGLIESSAQAAYLIGVSHPSSVAGRPGIIDFPQLTWAYQGIREHCDIVSSPNTKKQQKISALTVIAKHTSYLCSICRQASMNTNNPVAKNEFIVLAKQVATATSNLVQEIKSIEDDQSTPTLVEPLIDAVKAVRQYASNPEFISVPAKISAEGRKSQDPVINAGRGVIDGVIEMVKAAKSLALTPDDPPVWQSLSVHSTRVSESVKRLVDNIREKAPGQAQCEQVLHTLNTCTRELDSCALAVNAQGLSQRRDNNLHGFSGQTLNSAAELIDKLEPIRLAGKNNAEQLGHAVGEVSRYVVPMVNGAIGACTHIVHSNQQMSLINQTKSVVESAIQLVQSAKESAGNPRATHAHPHLDEAIENTREAIQELTQTVEKINAETGIVTGLMEQVNRAITRLTDKRQSLVNANYSDTFVDYQTRMVETVKEIARLANEMNAKSGIEPQRLPQLAVEMAQQYTQLTQDSVGASTTTTSPDVAIRIRSTVLDLGHAVSAIIKSTASGARPNDVSAQNEISRNARDVSEKVAQVLAALQAGSRGTQACINAAHTVSGIIGDLDTTIMFATAGTLHSDGDGTFADHREHILQTAKALVEDTKVLVTGAAGTQDQLASAAQNAVATIVQLAEAVKRGACSLGSSQPDSQVMVINAVKDVASALGDLINATKLASGKPIHDPSMQDLKESARVMVLNVSSLLKTVKAVEDEHTRGTRAMEATVEAISQEIRAMHSPPPPGSAQVGPEELIRVTKNVTLATAKAVAAGASNLQADIVAAANLGRRAISEMLLVCRSVAWNCAETEELRRRTLEAGAAVGESYRELLNGILHNCSADDRMHLSRRVAKCVTDLVAMARLLKGSDWIDPEDPTVIAENELLGAAASIDAAAKKLASLRPRRQPDVKIELDENMKFDEMILEAAKGIMAASSALVRAANAAQRELIDQGKVARSPLTSSDDGQWSEGLISAARLVAAATHSLVEAAQNLVRGVGTEEMLISTAKQVAASTAQLLIACKVKSNPNSEAGRRLQSAGNAVIKSTDNLVRAAQQALEAEEEHTLKINTSMVDGIAQEINARSDVLRMEKQLEEARQKLIHIRQARSRHRNAQGFTTDESDSEYTQNSNYGSLQRSQNNSLNRSGGIYGEMSSSPTSYAQQQKEIYHHNYNYVPPQHFHYPAAVSPPPLRHNRYISNNLSNYINNNSSNITTAATTTSLSSHLPPPPPPPPPHTSILGKYLNSSSSTTDTFDKSGGNVTTGTGTGTGLSTFRPNPKLTANAVPRPYPGHIATTTKPLLSTTNLSSNLNFGLGTNDNNSVSLSAGGDGRTSHISSPMTVSTSINCNTLGNTKVIDNSLPIPFTNHFQNQSFDKSLNSTINASSTTTTTTTSSNLTTTPTIGTATTTSFLSPMIATTTTISSSSSSTTTTPTPITTTSATIPTTYIPMTTTIVHHHNNNNNNNAEFKQNSMAINRNLEECVKDLQDKTYGPGGVVEFVTSGGSKGASAGQNYEGYTSRYETRNYESKNDGQPIATTQTMYSSSSNTGSGTGIGIGDGTSGGLESNFSQLTLNTDGGKISLIDQGSERLSSMTQRVLERKTFTTTTESRSEKKTESHSFRME